MGERPDDTGWRQGSVFQTEAAVACGLLAAETSDSHLVIVVSHDCDIAADVASEPSVELIVAAIIAVPSGAYTHNKNPRQLHLEISNSVGQALFVELLARQKRNFGKAALKGIDAPRPDLYLSEKSRLILQRWLAIRYRRTAFSDAFMDRMRQHRLDKKLADIVEPFGQSISAILFDVEDDRALNPNDEHDCYALYIVIIYPTDIDSMAAAAHAQRARDRIEVELRQKLLIADRPGIELTGCEIMSDEAISYRQFSDLKQWRLEYQSFRGEDQPIASDE